MSDKHPNEDVPIEVLKSASGKDYSAADCGTIRQLVREKLLLTSTKPYHNARVEVQMARDGSPEVLVVSLLRACTYTADRVRVKVDSHNAVQSIER